MTHYTQLTQEQRYQIYALNKAGFTQKAIAIDPGVHPSTISREPGRNTGPGGYRPTQVHSVTGAFVGALKARQECSSHTCQSLARA